MPRLFIYQSPRRSGGKPLISNPIPEEDERARTHLEGRGWHIIQTLGGDAPADAPTGEDGEGAALQRDHQWLRLVGTLTDDQQQNLIEAGYDTAESLLAATDADLQAVKLIGAAATRAIRKAAKAAEGE